MPFLIVGYAPTFREVGGGSDYGTDCRMVSTTAGYTHREGSVRFSTNGTYSLQTNSGGASEDYTGHTVSLREIVALPSDLSLTGAVTFHRSTIESVDNDRYVCDTSARYTLPSHWSATGGFAFTSAQLGAQKTTLRIGATTPVVGGLLTVDAEGEYTDFESDVEEGYTETTATVTATVVW
ncbi:hypothetical protein GF402_02725 [Candidatus Fermentibacteria bacterium]|nr:hypothetical protein [Candidatus Fermentibacteria bacterium]